MHGSRNVLITGNQFSQCVLWAIGLMSGSGAYPGTASENGNPAIAANVDGGSLITDNVISQFGYGDSYWMWKDSSRAVFRFDRGQEPTDPPLRDVLIQWKHHLEPRPGRTTGAGRRDNRVASVSLCRQDRTRIRDIPTRPALRHKRLPHRNSGAFPMSSFPNRDVGTTLVMSEKSLRPSRSACTVE